MEEKCSLRDLEQSIWVSKRKNSIPFQSTKTTTDQKTSISSKVKPNKLETTKGTTKKSIESDAKDVSPKQKRKRKTEKEGTEKKIKLS